MHVFLVPLQIAVVSVFLERPSGIQFVPVRADHRVISVDETCFYCLPFAVDFENNPFCVRISMQYIHLGGDV